MYAANVWEMAGFGPDSVKTIFGKIYGKVAIGESRA